MARVQQPVRVWVTGRPRLSTGRARGPWPTGGPGPDLKGQGPGRQVAGPAPFGRAKGRHMFELALGSDPGRTRTDPFGDMAMVMVMVMVPVTIATTHHHHHSPPPPLTPTTQHVPSTPMLTRSEGRHRIALSGHTCARFFFSFMTTTRRGRAYKVRSHYIFYFY